MNTDLLLVLDFGGNTAYYTARRLRGEQFYCELAASDTPIEEILRRKPKGILLVGGETDADIPAFDPDAFSVPLLALGGASRILASAIGAENKGTKLKQSMDCAQFNACDLFSGLNQCDRFFERLDEFVFPENYLSLATTQNGFTPAFGNPEKKIYGVQFNVETNDPEGLQILENFAEGVCGCERSWTVGNYAPKLIESIRAEIGDRSLLLPISSGPESAVTAGLLQRAVGSQLTCLFINTGLMRKGEPELVRRCYYEQMRLNLTEIDASDRFMKALQGVVNSEEKRRIMHDEYAAIFAEQYVKSGNAECMADSVTYSDILKKHAHPIPNVIEGCASIEPLRLLLKDDVRSLGRWLNIPEELINQPAFDFCGLGVRCLGEVTHERLDMLRTADAIFRQEVERVGLSHKIAQYFAILTDIRTPGQRGLGYVCALRALGSSNEGRAAAYKLPYDLMEAAVQRITGEVPGITHVVYDITGRPIAAVEWE